MFSVVALSASAIASPSIFSEIESGVLLTVVTRRPAQPGDWVTGLPRNPGAATVYPFAEGAS
jgi:hypothetical protein